MQGKVTKLKFNSKKECIRFLNEAFELTRIKKRLEREYNQKQKEVGNISISNLEIKTNNIISKVENKALNLVSLEEDIDLYNMKIKNAKKDIINIIDKLEDDTLKNLLRFRYLDFRKWEDIAYILGYSNKHIYKLHNKALKKVNKM